MGKNIEIKVRLRDRARTEARVAAIADRGPEEIPQTDVFFHNDDARLKLRIFADQTGELILYRRETAVGPATSNYERAPTSDAACLQSILEQTLKRRGVVRKQRRLYWVGQTRVHLDSVEGLGEFLELEVVLRAGQSSSEGRATADALRQELDIADQPLLQEAYIDLIEAARECQSR